jgi:hypothetical protein
MFSKLFGKKPSAEVPEKNSRHVEVGWLLKEDLAGMIWDTPKPVSQDLPKPQTSKSVQSCPAVVQYDHLNYVINCPVNLHLRINKTQDGLLQLQNVSGAMSDLRQTGLQKLIVMSPQAEWRHPARPILQLATPFVFVSDDPVYVNQFPPFLHYPKHAWPGIQICGRFPIDVWPRLHMWALEWHDLSRDLILKRGEPLFYVRFETTDPGSPVRLFEAERTPELLSYIRQITDVTNYVNQSFQVFQTARERRPEKLLFRKSAQAGGTPL